MNTNNEIRKEEYDLIMLFSGGADSRLMLELALKNNKEPLCLLINYGQLHIQELEYAKKQLNDKKIQYFEIPVNIPVNSGLTGTGEKGIYNGVHDMNVPGRNSIFLTIAASLAEFKGINEIWIGCDYSDREHLFPDCYQEYIVKINELFKIAFSYEIIVRAPLLGMTKELILETLKNIFGVNNEKEIFSGYGNL